jgi:DNA-binding CsgD family transcriptional regulator
VATLTASVARLLAMGAEGLAIPALLDLAELRAALGQADLTAQDAFDALAGRTGLDVHRGLTELAAAWGAAGDPPLAASHARRAVTFIGPNWPIYLARAQAFLGRVTPDRKEAVDALRSAVAIFDDCGALLRRAEALDVLATLGSAGKRAAGAARGPGSLTAQERSVAVLAASGLPAREIGERLFIGKRTVEGHLARAYAKLGVTSKVELARRAAELDLLPDA